MDSERKQRHSIGSACEQPAALHSMFTEHLSRQVVRAPAQRQLHTLCSNVCDTVEQCMQMVLKQYYSRNELAPGHAVCAKTSPVASLSGARIAVVIRAAAGGVPLLHLH